MELFRLIDRHFFEEAPISRLIVYPKFRKINCTQVDGRQVFSRLTQFRARSLLSGTERLKAQEDDSLFSAVPRLEL